MKKMMRVAIISIAMSIVLTGCSINPKEWFNKDKGNQQEIESTVEELPEMRASLVIDGQTYDTGTQISINDVYTVSADYESVLMDAYFVGSEDPTIWEIQEGDNTALVHLIYMDGIEEDLMFTATGVTPAVTVPERIVEVFDDADIATDEIFSFANTEKYYTQYMPGYLDMFEATDAEGNPVESTGYVYVLEDEFIAGELFINAEDIKSKAGPSDIIVADIVDMFNNLVTPESLSAIKSSYESEEAYKDELEKSIRNFLMSDTKISASASDVYDMNSNDYVSATMGKLGYDLEDEVPGIESIYDHAIIKIIYNENAYSFAFASAAMTQQYAPDYSTLSPVAFQGTELSTQSISDTLYLLTQTNPTLADELAKDDIDYLSWDLLDPFLEHIIIGEYGSDSSSEIDEPATEEPTTEAPTNEVEVKPGISELPEETAPVSDTIEKVKQLYANKYPQLFTYPKNESMSFTRWSFSLEDIEGTLILKDGTIIESNGEDNNGEEDEKNYNYDNTTSTNNPVDKEHIEKMTATLSTPKRDYNLTVEYLRDAEFVKSECTSSKLVLKWGEDRYYIESVKQAEINDYIENCLYSTALMKGGEFEIVEKEEKETIGSGEATYYMCRYTDVLTDTVVEKPYMAVYTINNDMICFYANNMPAHIVTFQDLITEEFGR